eukprot:GHVP01011300.1.p1 GENE.GHVP01011300.1~~GHVP01011300.1.p1  ORF type:complete len:123 (-),score=2.34 GHVP01011300.1:232-600(-)
MSLGSHESTLSCSTASRRFSAVLKLKRENHVRSSAQFVGHFPSTQYKRTRCRFPLWHISLVVRKNSSEQFGITYLGSINILPSLSPNAEVQDGHFMNLDIKLKFWNFRRSGRMGSFLSFIFK